MLLRSFFRKSRLTFAALLVLLSVALSLGVWSLKANSPLPQGQSSELLLTNQTVAFHVMATERDGDFFKVQIRNFSHQAINGYSILLGDGSSSLECDYTISGYVIAPGKDETFLVPVAEAYPLNVAAPLPRASISAVVFVDGTSDGDFKAADSILKRRVGIKTQLKRILPLLQAALTSPEADLTAVSEKLRFRIGSLAEQQEDGQSLSMKFGLRDAKDDIFKSLRDVEQKRQSLGGIDWRVELHEIKSRIEERLSRL